MHFNNVFKSVRTYRFDGLSPGVKYSFFSSTSVGFRLSFSPLSTLVVIYYVIWYALYYVARFCMFKSASQKTENTFYIVWYFALAMLLQ